MVICPSAIPIVHLTLPVRGHKVLCPPFPSLSFLSFLSFYHTSFICSFLCSFLSILFFSSVWCCSHCSLFLSPQLPSIAIIKREKCSDFEFSIPPEISCLSCLTWVARLRHQWQRRVLISASSVRLLYIALLNTSLPLQLPLLPYWPSKALLFVFPGLFPWSLLTEQYLSTPGNWPNPCK